MIEPTLRLAVPLPRLAHAQDLRPRIRYRAAAALHWITRIQTISGLPDLSTRRRRRQWARPAQSFVLPDARSYERPAHRGGSPRLSRTVVGAPRRARTTGSARLPFRGQPPSTAFANGSSTSTGAGPTLPPSGDGQHRMTCSGITPPAASCGLQRPLAVPFRMARRDRLGPPLSASSSGSPRHARARARSSSKRLIYDAPNVFGPEWQALVACCEAPSMQADPLTYLPRRYYFTAHDRASSANY
jgi:hypothetical protein